MNKALVIAPHADDESLGCGGTISKLISKEKRVECLSITFAELTSSPPSLIRKEEFQQAVDSLGARVFTFAESPIFLHRNLDKQRQILLDYLIFVGAMINPTIVFIPSKNDRHQDHIVVYEESLRAFRYCSILCYENAYNNSFSPNFFIPLTTEHLDKKIQAVSFYQSIKGAPYVSGDYIRSLARVRGLQCGSEFAEGFEVANFIMKNF